MTGMLLLTALEQPTHVRSHVTQRVLDVFGKFLCVGV
jgi:hypothetical protein